VSLATGLAGSKTPTELPCRNADSVGTAVWLNCQLDEIPLAGLFFVGNVAGHGVLFLRRPEVSMKLINRLQLGIILQRGECMTFSSLLRTIVDDRDLWLDGADERRVVTGIDPMMIDLEDIHRTDNVLRTRQPIFDVPGQIAAVEESETTKRKQNADAVGIVTRVFGFRFEILSTRSNLRRTGLLADDHAAGSDDAHHEHR